MKICKNNKGITLIALVVSIIVLLILAGISISMLTGQNGILNRATETKEKTDYAKEKEEISLAITTSKMENIDNTTAAVDESIIKFIEVKKLIIKLAEINNTMIRLQNAIEKLGRRSNALKEVIIPRDEKLAKKISLALEEEERDEFVRLKVVKRKQ